jgi:hypothetical protein
MGTDAGRWVLATTVLGPGLALIDATVVNVALGRIGTDFGADFIGLQWTVNACCCGWIRPPRGWSTSCRG